MILRCQNYLCRKEFDTDFNKLVYDKDKGRGYVCPHCYKWVRVGRFRDKPVPRMRPHGSKKDRLRQRREAKAKAMEKITPPPMRKDEQVEKTVDIVMADAEKKFPTEGKE